MNASVGFAPVGAARQLMAPSAALVTFARILAMTGVEFESHVEQELAGNPALERLEQDGCPLCAAGGWARCRLCDAPARRLATGPGTIDQPGHDVPHTPEVRDRLLVDVMLELPEDYRQAAALVVGELDDRGFLRCPVDELAAAAGLDAGAMERVIATLRAVGPPGTAASDARHCLLLQLAWWEDEHGAQPLVRALLTHHFAALASRDLAQLAAAVGTGEEDVRSARDFITTHLRPYPVWEAERPCAPARLPDLVALGDAGGDLDVHVVEPRAIRLRIDPVYERLAKRLDGAEAADVADQLRRARELVETARRRWGVLQLVGQHLVDVQRDFLRHGPRFLRPLTRNEVARVLDVHESTVGRAVSDRTLLLPSGRLLPMAEFFHASAPVEDAIRRLVAAETTPLSDGHIAGRLAEMGFPIARRTVAKYRNALGILPAALR